MVYSKKMIIIDLIFIIGCLFFLTFPFQDNQPITKIENIKKEIINQSELTPKVEEYLNKTIAIYNSPKITNPTPQITELNNQYPIEAGLVMNYLYQNNN
jgi:hypothetical protein